MTNAASHGLSGCRSDSSLAYRLGLPAWAFSGWSGCYWDGRPSPLAGYSQVFNAVEGNTTFYRTPDAQTVEGWRKTLAGRDFQFSFKLPRTFTHEATCDLALLREFLRTLAPLDEHLGPWLVQFPAWTGPADLTRIERILAELTNFGSSVLEVRHPQFFTEPERLDSLIKEFPVSRLSLDTRALYAGDMNHPEVRSARHHKPDLPVTPHADHGLVYVRMVLHPDPQTNAVSLDYWARYCAEALDAGHTVWVMIHCPNNQHCPPYARDFHQRLSVRCAKAGIMPSWPMPEQATLL